MNGKIELTVIYSRPFRVDKKSIFEYFINLGKLKKIHKYVNAELRRLQKYFK